MIETSELYKEKVYGQNRTFKMRINLGVTNTEMDENKENFAFSGSYVHTYLNYPLGAFDKRTSNAMQIATHETDRTLLDGSYVIGSLHLANSVNEQGLVSSAVAGSDGSYTNKPVFTFTFDQAYDVTGFTIVFDENQKEYATNFTISCLDSSGNSIYSETFTNNTAVTVAIAQEVLSMKSFTITVNSWCRSDRVARINEIEWGVSQSFTNDQLVNLNIIEEFDPNCLEVPETQISFTVDNGDNNFTIGNDQGFYKHLQSRQQVSADLGLVAESYIMPIDLRYEKVGELADYLFNVYAVRYKNGFLYVGKQYFFEDGVYSSSKETGNIYYYDLSDGLTTQLAISNTASLGGFSSKYRHFALKDNNIYWLANRQVDSKYLVEMRSINLDVLEQTYLSRIDVGTETSYQSTYNFELMGDVMYCAGINYSNDTTDRTHTKTGFMSYDLNENAWSILADTNMAYGLSASLFVYNGVLHIWGSNPVGSTTSWNNSDIGEYYQDGVWHQFTVSGMDSKVVNRMYPYGDYLLLNSAQSTGYHGFYLIDKNYNVVKTIETTSYFDTIGIREFYLQPLVMGNELWIMGGGNGTTGTTQEHELFKSIYRTGVQEYETVEYVPLGEFYINKWDTDSSGLTASFEGCSLLDVMSEYDYVRPISTSMTAYDLIIYIFELCDSPNYILDDSLKKYTINTNIQNDVDCKTALVSIANMCSCVVKMDRTGYVNVTPKTISEAVDTITFDEMYSYPTQTLNNLTGSVKVSYNADEDYNYITGNSGKQLSITNEFLQDNIEEYCNEIAQTEDSIRLELDVDWRGNPSLEMGDSVYLEKPFNKLNLESLYNVLPVAQPNGGFSYGFNFEYNGYVYWAGYTAGSSSIMDYNLYRLNPEDNTITATNTVATTTGWSVPLNSTRFIKYEEENIIYWFRTSGNNPDLTIYTFDGETWTDKGTFTNNVSQFKSYQNGTEYHMVGGYHISDAETKKYYYVYDMSTDTITSKDYPFDLYHRQGAGFVDNGKTYLIGGNTTSSFAQSRLWEIYDGETCTTWESGILMNIVKGVKYGKHWCIFDAYSKYIKVYIFDPSALSLVYIGDFAPDNVSERLDPILVKDRFYTIHNGEADTTTLSDKIYVSNPLYGTAILTKNEIKFQGYLKASSTFKTEH